MRDAEERARLTGAELFVTEALFDAVADLSDDAYCGGRDAEGMIAGKFFRDGRGLYAVAAGICTGTDGAVGWFRASAGGVGMTAEDIARHCELFGTDKAFAIMVDSRESSFAVYAVENGAARRINPAVLEG